MTLITGQVSDVGMNDASGVLYARAAEFRGDGPVVVTPAPATFTVKDGSVSADIAPGPTIITLHVGPVRKDWFVNVPESPIGLGDLIATYTTYEPAVVSAAIKARDAAIEAESEAKQAAIDAEAKRVAAETAANLTGQDRLHVDNVRALLDEAYDESQAGQALPPRLTETALNATYGRKVGGVIAPGVEGIVGDGAVDDTAAFQAILDAAGPKVVNVLPGTYLIHNVKVTGVTRLHVHDGAVLLHRPTEGVGAMFHFTGTVLRMRGGGLIDGNRTGHTGRPTIVTGSVESGKVLDIEGLRFKSTVHAIARVTNFGGYLNFSHNEVTDQAQHTGNGSEFTVIVNVPSGEQGAKGLIRTNHNRCIFTGEADLPGSNPGGFFVATNGYMPGSPGSEGFAHGNLSTWEAIGNYFEGYGQNCGPNDISPLHTYPTVAGARWVGNYFTRCGFSAVSAKSVQDFVFTNNIITDGLYSAKNISTEGAIAYLPGYQSSVLPRPRAVIANNIVLNPGGQSVAVKQHGINVGGTPSSFASDFIVSGNIIEGAGYGIHVLNGKNFTLSDNRVIGSKDGANGTEFGIRVSIMSGSADIRGNLVDTFNGSGLHIDGPMPDASVTVAGNTFNHDASGRYAVNLRGLGFAKMTGNTIHAKSGIPLIVGAAGVDGTPMGHFAYDESNTITGPTNPVFQYSSGIDKASGQLISGNDPTGRVTPAVAGTLARPYGGGYEGTLWVATGTTSSSWAQLGAGGGTSAPSGPAPTISVAAAVGVGATAEISGTDRAGVISVTPGTDSVAGAVATITFGTTRTTAPAAVMLTPANVTASDKVASVSVNHSSLTTSGFSLASLVALTGNTLRWYYHAVD